MSTMSFDVDWKKWKYTIGGMFSLVIATVLAFLIVSYALPWTGMQPHRITLETIDSLGSEKQARIAHDTTIRHLTNTTQVSDEAKRILDNCYHFHSLDSCLVDEISHFVMYDIEYTMDYRNDWPEPKTVLERGRARCVGRSVVAVSLLEYFNIESYYAYQEGHLCAMYVANSRRGFIGCHDGEFLLVAK